MRRLTASATAAVVVAATLVALPAAAPQPAHGRPALPAPTSVPVGTVPVKALPADPTRAVQDRPPTVVWPAAGRADTSVSATAGAWSKAGSLPVWLAAVPGGARPGAVRVELFDRDVAERAGIDGLLLQLSPVTDESGAVAPDRATVAVDPKAFASAYGADWARRLRLVRLPSCALSTPDKSGCLTATGLGSRFDASSGRVQAQVPVGASTVVALAAGPNSDSGDYSATALATSATWTAGGSSGDFGWAYPLRVPPGLGGPEPELSITYSAQALDGHTASTNNQPSWVGDGFDLATSYVERKYATCADDGQSGKFDLCWKYDNASLVLSGKASELVRDDTTGAWRLKEDDGSRVQKLTNPVANGDNDKEYWRVTTLDGTQYNFGLHQLPGWTTGKAVTNSVWTVPVAGDDANEPCHSTTFASSFCDQAWRWNLDYVVDPHGNVMTGWYKQETNYYAKNGVASPGTDYHRGGWPDRFEYGQRSTTIFTTPAPQRVRFGVFERCLPTASETCQSLTASNKSAWPDVPFDQICAQNAACTGKLAPTFFTRMRLTTVSTQVRRGSTYADVDVWTLDQSFPPPGDGGTKSLWLQSIQHSGKVGGSLNLSPVTFGGAQLANRVDALEGIAPVTKWRVRTITSETGATITINYAPTECTRAALPAPATNTKRCFPVYWTPPGQTQPQLDWFHKYVVAQVLQGDNTGGSETVETNYTYGGGAAWHYDDDDGLTPNKYRTWSHWRGYEQVTVTVGDASVTNKLKQRFLYLRGMDGDRTASGGPKNVLVTDSQGGVITDSAPLAGFVREQITFDGSAVVNGTIADPWTAQTASRTQSWGTIRATFVRTRTARTRTPLAAGGTRITRSTSTFESTYGQLTKIDDAGDESTSADDRCTAVEYARNTSAFLIAFLRRTETVAVGCSATPSRPADVVSDVRTSYDGQAFGVAPTKGDTTRQERVADYVSGAPVYQTVASSTFDAHGRMTRVTDALNNAASTAYTPSTGGPLTQIVVTNPLGHTLTSTIEPAWGAATAELDVNGRLVESALDPLGRVTSVWLANRNRSLNQSPNHTFAYTVSAGAPVAVASSTLRNDGSTYTTSYEISDSWLRKRQTQVPGVNGGRVITDTSYDSRGLPVRVLGDVFNASAPGPALVTVNAGAAPAQSVSTFDGAGRGVLDTFLVLGSQKWSATTTYGGDRISVDPPVGGVPTTTITDARGRMVERWEYDGGGLTGTHSTTRYAYDDADRLVSITDTAGTVWSYGYDLLGRRTRDTDPDKGVTTTAYDSLDRPVSTTDARGQTLATTYDALGRRTGLYAGAVAPANQLAGWTYDTATKGVGQPATATRFVGGSGGSAYTNAVVSYNQLYQPTRLRTVIPAAEGPLAGTYETTTAYNIDGTVQVVSLPAVGGLPMETLVFGYNDVGMPRTLAGLTGYVEDTDYDALGQPTQYALATAGPAKHVWLTMSYDEGTRRLNRMFAADETNSVAPTDRNYKYDEAGNLTRLADVAGTPDDVQCFGYDGQRRLGAAWTPASGSCAAAPTVAGLGGPAPYWLSWTYTATGLRASQTDHRATGDVSTTYAYPAASAARPHALTSTTTAGVTKTYSYDAVGGTTSRPTSTGTQTLTYDAEGRSATITNGSSISANLYDAGGTRLIRRDPSETVLYLGGTEVHVSTPGGVLSAVRYYQHNGVTLAVRTNAGLSWLVPDGQGTPLVLIDPASQAVTRRYQTPFGGARGTPPAWPNQRGYVGGVNDPAVELVRLGARDYDPVTGRFLSVDPVLDATDPQSLAAYTYADNNPVTFSDASGLMTDSAGGGHSAPTHRVSHQDPMGCATRLCHDGLTRQVKHLTGVIHQQRRRPSSSRWRARPPCATSRSPRASSAVTTTPST